MRGLTYVESVKEAVEQRMKSERDRIAEKYRSEGEGEYARIMGQKERDVDSLRSSAYRQASFIKGSADSAAVNIYAEGYNQDPDFFRFTRELELSEQALKGAKVIVGMDNPLLGVVKSAYSGSAPSGKKEQKKKEK